MEKGSEGASGAPADEAPEESKAEGVLAPFEEAYVSYIRALTDVMTEAEDGFVEIGRAAEREWKEASRVGDSPRAEQSVAGYAAKVEEFWKSHRERCRGVFREYVRAETAAWGGAGSLAPQELTTVATAESLAAFYAAAMTGSWD